jgi:hypothetical protein
VDHYRRLPEARVCDSLSALSECDGCGFLRGAGFDVYAVADTSGARSVHELAAELVPYVSAREPPRIYVLGSAFGEVVKKVPEQFQFTVESAQANSVAGQIVSFLAEHILQACGDKQTNQVFSSVSKKIRVIQDLVAGNYYTQSDPPPWS